MIVCDNQQCWWSEALQKREMLSDIDRLYFEALIIPKPNQNEKDHYELEALLSIPATSILN